MKTQSAGYPGHMVLGLNLCKLYPAIPGSLPIARRKVTALARAAGADSAVVDEIRLAVSEAVTNVIMHAYRDGGAGSIQLIAAAAGGELWVLVADDGGGLRPRWDSPGLGLGLTLIAHASDELTIAGRSSGGTELQMRFRLSSTADLDGSASLPRQGRECDHLAPLRGAEGM